MRHSLRQPHHQLYSLVLLSKVPPLSQRFRHHRQAAYQGQDSHEAENVLRLQKAPYMSEPAHIISLGAGVQSSTMALMAVHGEITPMPDYAIFADTQDEPASVYKWLDWLESKLTFPLVRVTRGKDRKSTRLNSSHRT